jgi:hypothetical protein
MGLAERIWSERGRTNGQLRRSVSGKLRRSDAKHVPRPDLFKTSNIPFPELHHKFTIAHAPSSTPIQEHTLLRFPSFLGHFPGLRGSKSQTSAAKTQRQAPERGLGSLRTLIDVLDSLQFY